MAIEFLCDLFIEHKVAFFRDILYFLRIWLLILSYPQKKPWKVILARNQRDCGTLYHLFTGKDPEVVSIFSELESKISKEISDKIQYIDVGEEEASLMGG